MIGEKRRRFSAWQTDIRNEEMKQKYHQVRTAVQRRVREMKNDWWEQKAMELQVLSNTDNNRAFCSYKKDLWVTSQGVRPVVGRVGSLLVAQDMAGIRDRWREHFNELLNHNPSV